MTFNARQTQIVKEFSQFPDWEQRYKHIVAIGKNLPPMEESLKTEDNKVKGCQSQVWLHGKLGEDKKIYFMADSDAIIVKGLVGLLIQLYSGLPPEEIINGSPNFLQQIELQKHLSPSRANGLYAMIKQIKYYAMAFKLATDRGGGSLK